MLLTLALWCLGSPARAAEERPGAAGEERPVAQAMDRLQEVLILRVDEGRLSPDELWPAILVGATAHPDTDAAWFGTRAIEVLQRGLGGGGLGAGQGELRLCAACMAPRAVVGDGALTWQAGPVSLEEVRALDLATRGEATPARSAIWLDEQPAGVSLRIVDLETGLVRFAQNVDPGLVEQGNRRRLYTLSEELERRARGDGLTQLFADVALFPGQHISLDWTDQWGATNANLTGLSISIFDPVLGIGGAHYRRVPIANSLLGGKVLLSIPTGAIKAVGDEVDEGLDPLVTVVGVARVPFGRSNYGLLLTASTNAEFGVGISLMNISLLPFLP